MSFRYSYGDFTTKGHGVIEGYFGYGKKSKGRKRRKPVKRKAAPKTIKLITQTDDLKKVIKYINEQNDTLRRQMIKDIDGGKIIRTHGYTIRKSGKVYKIYQSTKSKVLKNISINKETHQARVDEAYKHLLKINLTNKNISKNGSEFNIP